MSAEMSTSMVERVARAYEPKLWAQIDGDIAGGPFQSAAKFAREASLKNARAAIAAMRTPTEEMISACGNGECGTWAPGAWQLMIDTALKEGVP